MHIHTLWALLSSLCFVPCALDCSCMLVLHTHPCWREPSLSARVPYWCRAAFQGVVQHGPVVPIGRCLCVQCIPVPVKACEA